MPKTFGDILIKAKETFWGSGTTHPDIGTAQARPSDEDHGSRPYTPSILGEGKGPGPALGVQGNAFMRGTLYSGGKLIEFYTDYWLSTKYGSTITDGRKVRVKYIVAEVGVTESYWVRPHDHILKINQYAKGNVGFTILLPTLNQIGGAAGTIPQELQSYTARGLVADDQVDRQVWGRELYIESHGQKAAGDIFIRESEDLTRAGYMWTASATPNEWYLTLDNGATPGLANDIVFYINDVLSASAAPGALAATQHGFGNNDGLGFNTFYIFSLTDPNQMQIHAAYNQVARITVINEKFHIVAYWDGPTVLPDWNVLQQSRVTTSTTTTTTTTSTTSTTSTTTTAA